MEGLFSVKSDVYSFGVLLLEIVSGRRNTSFRHSDDSSLIGYVSFCYCSLIFCINATCINDFLFCRNYFPAQNHVINFYNLGIKMPILSFAEISKMHRKETSWKKCLRAASFSIK